MDNIESKLKIYEEYTDLFFACIFDEVERVKILLEDMNDEDINATGNTGYTYLYLASIRGYTETVKLLLGKMSNEAINARDIHGETIT